MAQDMMAPRWRLQTTHWSRNWRSNPTSVSASSWVSSRIVGAAFIGYALTIEVMIPVALYATTKEDTTQVTMKLADVEKKDDEKKKKLKNAPPKPRKKSGGGGKPRGQG